MILAKCSLSQGRLLPVARVHSYLVECLQNCFNWLPDVFRNISRFSCSFAVGFPSSSRISSLCFWSAFSLALGALSKLLRSSPSTLDFLVPCIGCLESLVDTDRFLLPS